MKRSSTRLVPPAALAGLALAAHSLAFDPPASFPLEPVKDDFQPNALDSSRFVDAPTGKHGFLTVKGERFVFEDGTPARFWGAQINLWSKEQVDYAVRRMRRQGINITRQHGMDYLNDRNGKTFFDYSPEGFDRLDYLISKLGENGIYLILDVQYPLHTRIKPGDNIPQLPEGGASASYAQFFDERVAAMTQRRMRDVFTHVNPYTRKRYADDPTIALVEIANEDSLFWGSLSGPFRSGLEEKFAAWLKRKHGADAPDALQPTLIRNTDFREKYFAGRPELKSRALDQLRFFYELENTYWQECRKMLREAGVKVPISGTNWQGHGFPTRVHMLGQAALDYIDRHGYWDHPQGKGNLQWQIATCQFHNLPMVKAVKPDQDIPVYLGVENLVTEKAWEQVLGLPMTISEWNTCLPNEHSLEGTGLMAAYGLMQGWDGSLQFGYFSPDWRGRLGGGSFDMFGNPPQILQFPAVAAMWYRGDVREAPLVAESLYSRENAFALKEDRKPLPLAAALVGKVGYRFVGRLRKPIVKDIRRYWDPATLTARSTTGELTWNAAEGVVTIDTARTQAVIGFLAARSHRLESVSLTSGTRFGAVYVTALDGLTPIRSARTILVTAVGPARNTGMQYETTSINSRLGVPYMRLSNPGQAPALLEAVTGRLEIRTRHEKHFKAWALDAVGRRLTGIPLTVEHGAVILSLEPGKKTVYYELALE